MLIIPFRNCIIFTTLGWCFFIYLLLHICHPISELFIILPTHTHEMRYPLHFARALTWTLQLTINFQVSLFNSQSERINLLGDELWLFDSIDTTNIEEYINTICRVWELRCQSFIYLSHNPNFTQIFLTNI